MRIFQLLSTGNVTFEEGGVRFFVPADISNRDYQEYLAWLEAGNTAEEWQPASEPVIEETPADSTEEEPVTEDAN
jgi:hypothetical protein